MRLGRPARAGYSFLEVQVAFILLGIGLAGLVPLIVIQVRLSKKIEQGFNPQTGYFKPGTVYLLSPSADPWERKLGVAATVQPAGGGSDPAAPAVTPPSYVVTITAPVEKGLAGENVTVHVALTKKAGSGSGGGSTP